MTPVTKPAILGAADSRAGGSRHRGHQRGHIPSHYVVVVYL
jgi:hypothetical protein